VAHFGRARNFSSSLRLVKINLTIICGSSVYLSPLSFCRFVHVTAHYKDWSSFTCSVGVISIIILDIMFLWIFSRYIILMPFLVHVKISVHYLRDYKLSLRRYQTGFPLYIFLNLKIIFLILRCQTTSLILYNGDILRPCP